MLIDLTQNQKLSLFQSFHVLSAIFICYIIPGCLHTVSMAAAGLIWLPLQETVSWYFFLCNTKTASTAFTWFGKWYLCCSCVNIIKLSVFIFTAFIWFCTAYCQPQTTGRKSPFCVSTQSQHLETYFPLMILLSSGNNIRDSGQYNAINTMFVWILGGGLRE